LRIFLALLLTSVVLAGCDRTPPDTTSQKSQPATETEATEPASEEWPQALLQEAQRAHRALQEATEQLAQAVGLFLAEPGDDSLQAARDAWRHAHQAYKAVEVYQSLNLTPVETAPSPQFQVHHSLSSRLDLHPLEPGYLDAVEGYPYSGLVFAESVPITPESLNEQHQFSDTAYVVLGFHPVEFLLWGENRNQQSHRSWHDFERQSQEPSSQADDQGPAKLRRRQLLSIITNQLAQDIGILCQAWQLPEGHYPSQFLKLPPADQHNRIRRALLQTLEQEINAPLQAALVTTNPQDGQPPESVFSQNTQQDLLAVLDSVDQILSKSRLLSPEGQEAVIQLSQQLRLEISQIQGPLFDAKAEHQERLRQAQSLATAMLNKLSAEPSS